MGLLNISGEKLSPLQTWVVISTIVISSVGSLGISIFRENKAVTGIQSTRDAVIRQGVEIEHIKAGQEEMRQAQSEFKISTENSSKDVISEVEKIKRGQQEIIDMGRFYIQNQDSISRDNMKNLLEDWVKKNEWIYSPISSNSIGNTK